MGKFSKTFKVFIGMAILFLLLCLTTTSYLFSDIYAARTVGDAFVLDLQKKDEQSALKLSTSNFRMPPYTATLEEFQSDKKAESSGWSINNSQPKKATIIYTTFILPSFPLSLVKKLIF